MGCQAMRALDSTMATRTPPPRDYRLFDAQPFGTHSVPQRVPCLQVGGVLF